MRGFLVWLSTLVVPLAVLSLIVHWPEAPLSPSIGGGGYDLENLLVTVLTLVFIGAWTLLTLIIACFHKDEAKQRHGLALSAIGGGFFISVLMLYGGNLP